VEDQRKKNKMKKQIRVKGYLRKVPGSSKKIRIKPQLRKLPK